MLWCFGRRSRLAVALSTHGPHETECSSMLRWIGKAAASVLGGAVLVGAAWWAVDNARLVREMRQLEQRNAELQRVVTRLETERRVAQLYVISQDKGPDGKVRSTTVDFQEIDRDGSPLPARRLTVKGDVIFVDALVVRFGNEYVERNDLLRGHSLHLFRRIFGEHDRPSDGQPLDLPQEIPAAYRTQARPSDFEQTLWRDFWKYASDPAAAQRLGVRVAQGEAVYQHVSPPQRWRLTTRADGGLEFTRDDAGAASSGH